MSDCLDCYIKENLSCREKKITKITDLMVNKYQEYETNMLLFGSCIIAPMGNIKPQMKILEYKENKRHTKEEYWFRERLFLQNFLWG
jgi:hypothetical protein